MKKGHVALCSESSRDFGSWSYLFYYILSHASVLCTVDLITCIILSVLTFNFALFCQRDPVGGGIPELLAPAGGAADAGGAAAVAGLRGALQLRPRRRHRRDWPPREAHLPPHQPWSPPPLTGVDACQCPRPRSRRTLRSRRPCCRLSKATWQQGW